MFPMTPDNGAQDERSAMSSSSNGSGMLASSNYLNELREQDRWLPINNVSRLMKNTLPATTKVSKDAKECMQECVSEFISFVTSEASDRCSTDKRKTINGEDILISLYALGFENYAEVLKIYLAKYRQQLALKNQMLYEQEVAEMEQSNIDSAAADAGVLKQKAASDNDRASES